MHDIHCALYRFTSSLDIPTCKWHFTCSPFIYRKYALSVYICWCALHLYMYNIYKNAYFQFTFRLDTLPILRHLNSIFGNVHICKYANMCVYVYDIHCTLYRFTSSLDIPTCIWHFTCLPFIYRKYALSVYICWCALHLYMYNIYKNADFQFTFRLDTLPILRHLNLISGNVHICKYANMCVYVYDIHCTLYRFTSSLDIPTCIWHFTCLPVIYRKYALSVYICWCALHLYMYNIYKNADFQFTFRLDTLPILRHLNLISGNVHICKYANMCVYVCDIHCTLYRFTSSLDIPTCKWHFTCSPFIYRKYALSVYICWCALHLYMYNIYKNADFQFTFRLDTLPILRHLNLISGNVHICKYANMCVYVYDIHCTLYRFTSSLDIPTCKWHFTCSSFIYRKYALSVYICWCALHLYMYNIYKNADFQFTFRLDTLPILRHLNLISGNVRICKYANMCVYVYDIHCTLYRFISSLDIPTCKWHFTCSPFIYRKYALSVYICWCALHLYMYNIYIHACFQCIFRLDTLPILRHLSVDFWKRTYL